MRVLVTGANGFVGRHLHAALTARGHTVIGCGSGTLSTHELALDLHDPLSIRGVVDIAQATAVMHLAAQSFVPASIVDPLETFMVNATGTLHLLNAIHAARENGAPNPRIVVAGSADVYGVHPMTAYPLRETTMLQPANPYAASKIAAEAMTVAMTRSHGLNAVVTRAFNHIGPGQDERFAVASFAMQLARISVGGNPRLLVGNLDAQRDWGHARDYVEGMWRILQHTHADDFVLATGKTQTVRLFVERAFAHVGITVEWRGQGVEERGVCAKSGKLLVEVDPRYFRPTEVELLIGDPAKAKAELGWEATTSFDELVTEMMAADLETVEREAQHRRVDEMTLRQRVQS